MRVIAFDSDHVRRALAAWFRTPGDGVRVPMQPAAASCYEAEHGGHRYVVIGGGGDGPAWAVYRIQNDGQLRTGAGGCW